LPSRTGEPPDVSELITPTSERTKHWQEFMLTYFWIALGGALGSASRHWLSSVITDATAPEGSSFPWGTLTVNISGSLVIGFLAAFTDPAGRRTIGPGGRQFFMYGLCGGYTTFSAFSLQTFDLLRDRQWLHAGGNVMLSVVLCVLAVWVGYLLGAACNSTKGN
jgi:fluoride exporter